MDEYIAVISHDNPGAGKKGEDWVFSFRIAARIKNGSEVIAGETVVFKNLKEQELSDYFPKITPYTIIRFYGNEIMENNGLKIQLGSIEETGLSHHELKPIIDELRRPVVRISGLLGEMTLDKKYDWFVGKGVWNSTEVEVCFAEGESGFAANEVIAQQLWGSEDPWISEVNRAMLDSLLDLRNNHWSDADEPLETEESFLQKIQVSSVMIFPDGKFHFWYSDGDMFGNHAIFVAGSLEKGVTSAEIAG